VTYLGAIDVMASALFGIYLPSCGIIGWSFGKIGQVHHGAHRTELCFGRGMAARGSGQNLTKVAGDGSRISVPVHVQGPISSRNLPC
jgi:hypothetical protein